MELWSCMGGEFPEGKEANSYRPDPESTQRAVKNWPGEVVFAGWEIGNKIITDADYLKKSISPKSPVWRAYQLYNNFSGRPGWDQVSVLYAVASQNDYWTLHSKGYVKIAEDGSNQWISGKESNRSYLIEKMAPEEVAKIIDALMAGIYPPGI